MKKIIILILILIIVCTSSVFAFYRVQYTTMDGLDYYLKQFEIEELTQNEKLTIYDSMKQSAVIPTIMNLGIGFGKGSMMVGDKTGEKIGLIADSIAWGALTTSLCVMCFDLLTMATLSREYSDAMAVFYSATMYGGISILVVSHIVQAIMPSIHVSKYNKKLKESLGLTDADIKLGLIANVDLSLSAVASIQF